MQDLISSILYRDEHYLAINKPSGLLVHPSLIDRHEKQTAVNLLQDQLQTRLFITHRLDKPTSGVLLFALHQEAARKAMEAFSSAEVKKAYLAIVRGYTKKWGEINAPLPPVHDKLMASRTSKNKAPKAAETQFRKLDQVEIPVAISRYPQSRYSLLEVHPLSGRMHQIRRHLRQIRHPVIGDTRYGDHKHNRYFREEIGCPRLLLAATELSFLHPYKEEHLTLTAPVDRVFFSIVERFGWRESMPAEWIDSHGED